MWGEGLVALHPSFYHHIVEVYGLMMCIWDRYNTSLGIWAVYLLIYYSLIVKTCQNIYQVIGIDRETSPTILPRQSAGPSTWTISPSVLLLYRLLFKEINSCWVLGIACSTFPLSFKKKSVNLADIKKSPIDRQALYNMHPPMTDTLTELFGKRYLKVWH